MSPLKNTRRSQPNELKVVEEYKYPDSEKKWNKLVSKKWNKFYIIYGFC